MLGFYGREGGGKVRVEGLFVIVMVMAMFMLMFMFMVMIYVGSLACILYVVNSLCMYWVSGRFGGGNSQPVR